MILISKSNLFHLFKMSCPRNLSYSDFVKNGRKILGAGLNYNAHLKVRNVPKPTKPIIFLKSSTSYIQEGQDIMIPNGFDVTEEIELGVIIGKKCKHVAEKDAMNYVAGYCVALDLTALSELLIAQKSGLPWTIFKSFDTACPVSRFISKEEIPDPHNVDLWLSVDGQERQKCNTSDFIFSIPNLISYISQSMTLEPNDLILTGTPPGMSPILPGNVVKGGIKDLITITFNVKAESA